jgi:type VI secretion system protein ImpE
MSASDLFKAGQLQAALDAQTAEVRSHPADQARRLFLFELLCFAGEIDRARKQLDVLNYDLPELQAAVHLYREVLDSEKQRRGLFAGEGPQFFGEPPEHLTLRWKAAEALRHGRPTDAVSLLDHAQSVTPSVSGHLNGTPFEQLRDADDLLAGVLEVFHKGRYFWVPFEQITTLAVSEPKFPRDLLYAPARLDLHDGSSGQVFLPTLYPGTHTHADEAMKLGRATDWNAVADGPVLGVGLHTYLVDEGESTLLEWRMLEGKGGEA